MFRKLLSRIIIIIGVILFFNPGVTAQIRLPRLISNGMVLQRDRPVRVWGWANIGENVTVKLKDKLYATKAGADHRWEIELPATAAGGPYQMVIEGSNQIILNDILFGDVWVCSGQSNLEFTMDRAKEKYAAVIAGSTNPAIRQFFVKPRWSFQPKDDVASPGWLSADPQNVLQFTAVGYFFASVLYEKYHVPIGLINASVGGTPAEAWTSTDGLMKLPGYLEKIEPYRDSVRVASILTSNSSLERNWNQQILQNDSGFANKAHPWTDGLDNSDHWDTLNIPGALPERTLSDFSGVIWLKRTVTLPHDKQPRDAVLLLGSFSDRDTTYVNGHRVGFTPNRYQPRKYQVPARWLHSGDNTIVIRTVVTRPPGTFTEGKPYEWQYGDTTLLLTGKWLYRIGFTATPFPVNRIVNFNNQPTALYNAMIAPLTPYNIKGVIWYQGEANTTRGANIDLQLHIPSTPLIAWVDEDAFNKILSNLLSNAIKYARSSVSIRLLQENEHDFTIVVKNDGAVLAKEMANKIFEPFVRSDIHKNKPGTGIGLSLAKTLVDLHQGKLEYVTEKDQLNTFILTIPFHQPVELNIGEEAGLPNTTLTASDTAKEDKLVILLVEDQKDFREFVMSLLSETYKVLGVADATQAKELLDKQPVNLIISDVMIPGIDGFEFCRQLKNDINFSHIPLILLTAKDTFASKIEGLDCGSDAFIEKPFSPKHLKLQIVNLLKNRDNIKQHYAASPVASLQTVAHSKADAEFLHKLDSMIKLNLARPDFDIDELASMMNMSRPTLYRKVKAITDLSPLELVTITRLKRAAEMLLMGDYKIYEIAEQVGFTSSSVLGRAFQKQFGMSPSAYVASRPKQ